MTEDQEIGPEELSAFAAFLPTFIAAEFSPGTWQGGERQGDGSIQMPWFDYNDAVLGFIQAAYDLGFVKNFGWPEWISTEEAVRLRDDPKALATANVEQLAKLITVIIRQDRFAEGALAEAIKSGFISSILERVQALAEETDAQQVGL